jgi:hypothetical protein
MISNRHLCERCLLSPPSDDLGCLGKAMAAAMLAVAFAVPVMALIMKLMGVKL